MSDPQYNRYKNLNEFAITYRKYVPVTNILNEKDFATTIKTKQYIKMEYLNSNRNVYIYLLGIDSKYSSTSNDLKTLLAPIKDPTDVILISKDKLGPHLNKTIIAYTKINNHINIHSYLYENFDLIIPKGPLCYPHRILSQDEIINLLNNEAYCKLINLPEILVSDVQCIWLGANVGDVIEIKSLSDISLEYIHYRVVVPVSGYSNINPVTEPSNLEAEVDEEEIEIDGNEEEIIEDTTDEKE